MSDLTPQFSPQAVAGLLRWTHDFSDTLDREKKVELRMNTLRFVAQGFPARDPGFDLEEVARGQRPAGAPEEGVSVVTLIQAFRFFDEQRDQRGVTAALLVWHLVGQKRAAPGALAGGRWRRAAARA